MDNPCFSLSLTQFLESFPPKNMIGMSFFHTTIQSKLAIEPAKEYKDGVTMCIRSVN